MEIERKFLVRNVPELELYRFHLIEQAYLCTSPVVRVRRQDEEYILTYKGAGMMAREEYNLPLTRESYEHLIGKADGNIITKKRYLIPLDENLKAELDIFEGKFSGLIIAEVEFPDEESAHDFSAPDWFGEEVTYCPEYHNSALSRTDTWEPSKSVSP
ncbi:MAG: CYTH domain-containing protein [Candidatus Choladocola sp.]|nr:CYTH domain-containing protein [Candidatus Choladocola sp.]